MFGACDGSGGQAFPVVPAYRGRRDIAGGMTATRGVGRKEPHPREEERSLPGPACACAQGRPPSQAGSRHCAIPCICQTLNLCHYYWVFKAGRRSLALPCIQRRTPSQPMGGKERREEEDLVSLPLTILPMVVTCRPSYLLFITVWPGVNLKAWTGWWRHCLPPDSLLKFGGRGQCWTPALIPKFPATKRKVVSLDGEGGRGQGREAGGWVGSLGFQLSPF